jgi:hypothetical protein
MSTLVTLHVYSGRPDPVFQLSDQQEGELHEKLSSAITPTDRRPSGVYGGLGYRGFSITRSAEIHAAASRTLVHEGIVEGGSTAPNVVDNVGLESWLAETVGAQLPVALREYVSGQIGSAVTGPVFQFPSAVAPSCPPCRAADAPAYDPAKWNTPTVQPYNNCYNYANDQITNTFAQPGRATGHQATVMACPNVTAGATSDGLHSVANFSGVLPKGGGWYVALVVWPGNDYHWYRQDNVGCWSHKPGSTPARNTDNSGNPISDPKTCNRGPYTDFCTYMVTNRSVLIR